MSDAFSMRDDEGERIDVDLCLIDPALVWLEVFEDGSSSAALLTPKKARKLAKALNKWAGRAEG